MIYRKRKLFGSWHKTDKTGSSGATLLLHNTLRAFKFPDESQVYLKCDIEVSLCIYLLIGFRKNHSKRLFCVKIFISFL